MVGMAHQHGDKRENCWSGIGDESEVDAGTSQVLGMGVGVSTTREMMPDRMRMVIRESRSIERMHLERILNKDLGKVRVLVRNTSVEVDRIRSSVDDCSCVSMGERDY